MRSLLAYLALPLLSLSLTFATACTEDPTDPPIDDRIVDTIDLGAGQQGPDELAEGDAFVLDLAALGQACGDRADGADACPRGLTCLSYAGVGGPAVGMFATCEIPCRRDDAACPSGTACIEILDGPGKVCEAVR